MRTDTERAERAIWKLGQGGYTVRMDDAGYIVIGPDSTETMLSDLAALVGFADAVYERIWARRKITPSA